MVTKRGEILESHRLVVGSNGVVEGRFRGARSWGCRFPTGDRAKDLDVDIFVRPLGGEGEPIRFEIMTLSAEDKSGFLFASVLTH